MLIEKLGDDIKLIESYISAHGENNNSDRTEAFAPIEYRLRFWESDKRDLFKLFGEELILEREISYIKGRNLIVEEIDKAMYNRESDMYPFHHAYRSYLNSIYSIFSDEADVLYNLINSGSLADNKMTIAYGLPIKIKINGKTIKIDKNTRPIRALGKIAKALGLEQSFEHFRIAHSRILNDVNLTGTLCLSIHPLDYMTLSDNENNWSSCMSWQNDGCYRLGTVEMMNSPIVVVGYLKSADKKFKWYNGAWNSKQWRCLYIVDQKGLVSIKGYPYSHSGLNTIVIDWLKELANINMGWQYGPTQTLSSCIEEFEYADGNTRYIDVSADAMYNDFGCADYTVALPMFEKQDKVLKSYFHISGVTECMCCGDNLDPSSFYEEGYVFCMDCCTNADEEEYYYCECCGRRLYEDEAYYCEGEYYCCDCVNDVGAECVINGDRFYFENLTKVYIASVADQPTDDDEFQFMYTPYATGRYNLPDWNYKVRMPHFEEESGIYYLNKTDVTPQCLRNWWNVNPDGYFKD